MLWDVFRFIVETAKSTLGIQGRCDIEFLAGGAFNKLYVVKSVNEEVVVRVTLPIDPKWKTLSEVATLRWVRQNTTLPVPDVLTYAADRSNPIGFEWIIMNKVRGVPLSEAWKEIPLPAKAQLVRRIASFFAETFQHQQRGIGNIFPNTTSELASLPLGTSKMPIELPSVYAATKSPSQRPPKTNRKRGGVSDLGFTVERMVSSPFIGQNVRWNSPRGPFATSAEWMMARMNITWLDCSERLNRLRKPAEFEDEKAQDEDHTEAEESLCEEDLTNALAIIERLRNHLTDFFTVEGPNPEPSIIFHDDMNRHNILVDDNGALAAVVDWECVSALPLYMACQYPPFSEGRPNDVEPIKSMYEHDEKGEVTEHFWEHLEDYELTQLRRVFLEEMEKLQPEWVVIFKSSQRQRDFDLAVSLCDDDFAIRRIMRWLDDLDSGAEGVQGLEERIDNCH